MAKDMTWLKSYERERHSNEPNESWISSRFDIQGLGWRAASEIYLPELRMTLGKACNSLKKLWKNYKIAGRTGEYRDDIAWKIVRIESVLGIEKTEFSELEGMDLEAEMETGTGSGLTDGELSDEEVELRREELEDERENDEYSTL